MATGGSADQTFERPTVGERAPLFALPSVRGPMVDLASYRDRRNVIVWFSRGFTASCRPSLLTAAATPPSRTPSRLPLVRLSRFSLVRCKIKRLPRSDSFPRS